MGFIGFVTAYVGAISGFSYITPEIENQVDKTVDTEMVSEFFGFRCNGDGTT